MSDKWRTWIQILIAVLTGVLSSVGATKAKAALFSNTELVSRY